MKTDRDALGWAAMLASIAVTAHGEWSLAVACGYATVVAAGLPIAIDAYAIRAMRAGREIFPPVLLMVATNAGAHLVHGGMLRVTPWLVVLVSAIAPVVLWRVHALRRCEHDVPGAAEALDVIQGNPAPTAERVPEMHSEPRPVPEAVPAGVRTLPIVARPESVSKVLVAAAEHTRTRAEVHADWTVPGDYAPSELAPLTDHGLGLAAQHFKDELLSGQLPSIRAIKERLSVGQNRAKEIQDGFRQAQVAWRLAGSGATA